VKSVGKVVLLAVLAALVLAGGALAQEKGFLWDGHQWLQLSYDAKVGYVKGVGNLSDFEMAASKGKGACVSWAFAKDLRTKTVGQIVDEVDRFYHQNPGKLDTSVLEVMVEQCTKACPPGMAGVKK
jgi:hypothetical protein